MKTMENVMIESMNCLIKDKSYRVVSALRTEKCGDFPLRE